MVLLSALPLAVQSASQGCNERQPTPGSTLGPHDFSFATTDNKLWREGDAGEPLFLRARVLDTCGKAVVGAQIRVLHANQDGDHEPDRWRTNLESDERGEFGLVTVYPGYAGGMARHIHFIISHPDHPQLVTRLFFKNDPAMDASVEDLAVVPEVIQRGQAKGWVAGYEFVLPSN